MLGTVRSDLRGMPFTSLALGGTPKDILDELIVHSLVLDEDWGALPASSKETICNSRNAAELLARLVQENLITPYLSARIQTGKLFGLKLGNYRVLDRLGVGAMGLVFKAEHLRLRRLAAIKVMAAAPEIEGDLLRRFMSEIRAVAQLQHPHIVAAIDAGEERSTDPDQPPIYYFVMEYVPGKNLEDYVAEKGPLPVPEACSLICQIASALTEAHQHNLIHRDIKPSNILITAESQAKLLDFGLAQHFRHRLTEPGTVMGTIDYMAPEQARDASRVDARADIYGLGATLFWCLTGQSPFPPAGSVSSDLIARITKSAPTVRSLRMDIPHELDAIVARMMSHDPDDRFPTARAVIRQLIRYLDRNRDLNQLLNVPIPSIKPAASVAAVTVPHGSHHIMVVDANRSVIGNFQDHLQAEGLVWEEVDSVSAALESLAAHPVDLVLIDLDQAEMSGPEVVRSIRERFPLGSLKLMVSSSRLSSDDLTALLLEGADECVIRPTSPIQIVARLKSALRIKSLHDRTEMLNQHLLNSNRELEKNLTQRDGDLVRTRNSLVLGLTQMLEMRQAEPPAHRRRMQQYCRILAEEAAQVPDYFTTIDESFIQRLEIAVILHDIGMIALPDAILLKPGKLDPDERIVMQEHTTLGAAMIQELAGQLLTEPEFWQMVHDIVRHHHERFDGTGYPDRLAGSSIPLAARFVALADVYDALRSRRVYKPPLSHVSTMQIIISSSPGQFDPALIPIFQRCASRWEAVYREVTK